MSRARAPVLCGLRCSASTAAAEAKFASTLNHASSYRVTEGRLSQAITRLDQALARVERASDRVASRPDPAFTALMRRHEHLRERTQDAIKAIDRLTGVA